MHPGGFRPGQVSAVKLICRSYVEGAGADPLVEPVYAKDLICRAIADRERTEDNRGALGKDQFCFRNSHGAYAHDIVRSKDLLVYRRWLAFVKEGNTQSWMHLFDLLYSLKHTEAHHRSNYVAQKTFVSDRVPVCT